MTEKKISRVAVSGKLFNTDTLHIHKKVKEMKTLDPKFKDISAALRFYVNLGIQTEEKIIKAKVSDSVTSQNAFVNNQGYGFGDRLDPLKKSIDGLITAMKVFRNDQEQFFKGQSQEYEQLRKEIGVEFEELKSNFSSLFQNLDKEFNGNNKNITEIIKQVIIHRCMLYVFLLGVKPGKVDTNLHFTSWESLVRIIEDKASAISEKELERIANSLPETPAIKEMSGEVFNELKRLTKTAHQLESEDSLQRKK